MLTERKKLEIFLRTPMYDIKKHTAENENYFSDFHTQTLAQCQNKKKTIYRMIVCATCSLSI